MNRRGFLSGCAGIAAVSASSVEMKAALFLGAEKMLAIPTADQLAWQDLEVGMFVHFAPNTWQDIESDDLSTPLAKIDPKKLDTDQWAKCALALGAKYIVFVAKHQGGFCMWQTETTSYSIAHTPWKDGKGDVLREVSESCKRFGLKLGVYLCPRDDNFGAKTGGFCKTPELQQKYDAMYRQQLTEVLSRYGAMVEVWFDGSCATPVSDILQKYASHAMVFQGKSATIRWVGNEQGFAPYPAWNSLPERDARSGVATALNSDPNGDAWMPNEVDVSIRRPNWFWSTKNDNLVMTEKQLLEVYYRSVGRGAQLLLNLPPNRDGLIAEADFKSVQEFGQEIHRRFGTALAETSGRGSSVTVKLRQPTQIDTVVLQEDCAHGERVRLYQLEGRHQGQWTSIGNGSAIGHKRIQPITPVTVDAVRFTATESAALAIMRRIALYSTGTNPPESWDAPAELWAADSVGKWTRGEVLIDLTKYIKSAAQYQLRFVPEKGDVTALREPVLTVDGIVQPALIHPVRDHSDRLTIDITSVGPKVLFKAKIAGSETGSILFQKL